MNTTTGSQRYNQRMSDIHEDCKAIESEKQPGPKHRISLRNDTHGVEFRNTNLGRKAAVKFRNQHPEFRGRKLRTIIQMRPQEVTCGIAYALT